MLLIVPQRGPYTCDEYVPIRQMQIATLVVPHVTDLLFEQGFVMPQRGPVLPSSIEVVIVQQQRWYQLLRVVPSILGVLPVFDSIFLRQFYSLLSKQVRSPSIDRLDQDSQLLSMMPIHVSSLPEQSRWSCSSGHVPGETQRSIRSRRGPYKAIKGVCRQYNTIE